MKNFEVLVQKNGRIEWLPVPGCISHAEARAQGEQMYSGKVIQTRFLRVSSSTSSPSSSNSSSSSSGDWGSGFALCTIALGGIIIISLWPLFLVGGLSYLGYKLYKKYVQNESNS